MGALRSEEVERADGTGKTTWGVRLHSDVSTEVTDDTNLTEKNQHQ
jgi:hypothetical protein